MARAIRIVGPPYRSVYLCEPLTNHRPIPFSEHPDVCEGGVGAAPLPYDPACITCRKSRGASHAS